MTDQLDEDKKINSIKNKNIYERSENKIANLSNDKINGSFD